jgi:glyoxylase-like metal-dependent hydrolase (beta-lactamase superfamily II)
MYIKTVEVKIAGNPRFTTNCYLVAQSKEADSLIAIDPGDEADVILRAIGNKKLEAIILTHGHYDHIGAVAELVDKTAADVYTHVLEAENIKTNYKEIVEGFAYFTRLQNAKSNVEVDLSFDNDKPTISHHINGTEFINIAGLELEVIHTPGHTPGGVCLYSAKDGVLFSGDTLFLGTCGRTDFGGGSPQSMHDSLQLLSQLPKETVVYPGHGASTTINDELNRGLSEY